MFHLESILPKQKSCHKHSPNRDLSQFPWGIPGCPLPHTNAEICGRPSSLHKTRSNLRITRVTLAFQASSDHLRPTRMQTVYNLIICCLGTSDKVVM